MDGEGQADVIVAGAGAAGLAAALTARAEGATVLLLEAAAKLGGAAAMSGGIVWAPGVTGEAGEREGARAYLAALGAPEGPALDAFVESAADAIGFLEARAGLRFAALPGYPDYFLDRPGARAAGGRALDSGLFAFARLGDWRDRVADNGAPYPFTVAETPLGGGTGVLEPAVLTERAAGDVRGFGQSLVGHLLEACLDAGVRIRVSHRVTALEETGGRIAGVIVATPEGDQRRSAMRGVILATGGFEWDDSLAASFLRGPIARPASPPTGRGDGLKLAMRAGASLANMTSAWWCPTIAPPQEAWPDGSPKAWPCLIERTMPGSLIVNRAGRRFANEAENYSSLMGAFHAREAEGYGCPNLPAWLVFDHGYKRRVMVANLPPGDDTPAWIASAPTLAGLGAAIGVEGAALTGTVARFNAHAADGHDPDFGRGAGAYDRFYGDRSRPGALATLGPLAEPPFHAVELHPGVLGTNGGARTDGDGRVLGHDGAPLSGLYAAGNVAACPTGPVYAGAGGTLGPALTMAWRVGRHAARRGN